MNVIEQQVYASLTESFQAALAGDTWASNRDNDFCGGSREETEKYAQYGWPAGAREASEKSRRIVERTMSATGNSLTTELQCDVVGAAYDVGALMSGEPECWIRPEPALSKRAIAIAYNCSVSCAISADQLRTRGIAVASLVLALQSAGYPVTVDVHMTAYADYQDSEAYSERTRIIDAATGSQLDIDRLVFALAHPCYFRRITQAHWGARWGGWHPPRAGSQEIPNPRDYDLVIGGAHANDSARWTDGGEAWVIAEYERQTKGINS